jgi:hypothetical protein
MKPTLSAQTASAPSILLLRVKFAEEHGLIESIVLNQILYWVERSGRMIDGAVWIYNTLEQWHEQFPFISERTIRRALRKLENLGFIFSERKEAHYWNQRKWYRVNREPLEPYISPIRPDCPNGEGQIGPFKNKDSISENTKGTITGEAPNSINPPTHPVVGGLQKVDKETTSLNKMQTGTGTNPEIQERQDVKLSPLTKPKLRTQYVSNSKEETISPAPLPDEIVAKIVETIAPAPLNQNIRKQLLKAQTDVIHDALALVNQQKAQGKAKNPAGLLVRAVQNNWKPNPTQDTLNRLPDDFNEWFELARKAGLAIGSTVIDGVLCIFTNTHEWEPYEEFRAGFGIPWLRRYLGLQV